MTSFSPSCSFTQITTLSSHIKSTKLHLIITKTPPSHSLSFTSSKKSTHLFSLTENGAGSVSVEQPSPPSPAVVVENNGAAAAAADEEELVSEAAKFENPKWVNGTWDLSQFQKDDKTDWDAVIDAEVRRRKWLQDTPESSSNDNPVSFDTSIIPWWAWIKRFHLPEAELLNGRAAMVGFFMAYFVDSLTGVGLVDQMNNFFCKTLLFIAVSGVLFIRKNEDVEKLKKLIDETTFYDKQWQATWQDETTGKSKGD